MSRPGIAFAFALLILSVSARAQSTGPDVIVAALHNIANYSAVGGTDAFSVGTTSCNIGTTPLLWQATTPNHPVIAQHLYRIADGRCDMIGQAWLKHGFATVDNGICGSCTGPTGQQLYPFCSDPYDATLNGTQSGLGPKFEVDAHTGTFPYPFTGQFASGNDVYKRLQFALADVDPATYPGATYWVEAHYVSPDDAAAGNQDNNTSVREVLIGGSPVDRNVSLAIGSTTLQQTTALEVWPTLDPAVQLQVVDVPGEGRLQVAMRGTDLQNGSTRYVYAVHNLNSHRSVRQIDIAMPAGALVQNLDFHAPVWHSGEPYSNAAWPGVSTGSAVTWSTDTEAVDPNANAIRWGTTYTFSFDSDLPPTGSVTLGLFRAGSPTSVSTVFIAPPFTLALPLPAPATVPALATTPVDVQVTPVGDTHDPADALLRYSVNGSAFVSTPLVYLGGDLYRANLPPIPFGFQLDWYVEIGALGGPETVTFPNAGAAAPLHASAVTDLVLFADDFESDLGWTVANTNLADGAWERDVPTSGGVRGDPLADADGSGFCYLTDNAGPSLTNSDVDGGPTVLTSPVLDVSGYGDVYVHYEFWYVNDFNSAPNDVFLVEINDNVGSGWVTVEQKATSTNGWEERSYRINDYCQPSASVQIRFTVDDTPNDSVVEAGRDAFSVFAFPLLIEEYARGNVGANSGPPQAVLRVNGSTGGATRHVIAPVGSPLSFSVLQPTTHPIPANIAIFGRVGIPGPQEAYDIGLGIGIANMVPCPAQATNPLLFVLANNLVGTNCPPALPATFAPWFIGFPAGIGFPVLVTFQGVVSDADNALTPGAAPFSVTNAVIYETR